VSDLRPLDRLGLDQGQARACSVVAVVRRGVLSTWYGVVVLGWWPRYTLPSPSCSPSG
jgi:hypothetical protein